MADNQETKKPIPELRLAKTHLTPVRPPITPEEWADIQEFRASMREAGEEILAEAKAKEEAEAKAKAEKE